MSNVCSSILVGVAFPISEILLPFDFAKFLFRSMASRPSYTRQLVASNICGYFDLVSNMLPRIESCSISGNMLLGC